MLGHFEQCRASTTAKRMWGAQSRNVQISYQVLPKQHFMCLLLCSHYSHLAVTPRLQSARRAQEQQCLWLTPCSPQPLTPLASRGWFCNDGMLRAQVGFWWQVVSSNRWPQRTNPSAFEFKTLTHFLKKNLKCYPHVMFLSILDRVAKLLTVTDDKSGHPLKGGWWWLCGLGARFDQKWQPCKVCATQSPLKGDQHLFALWGSSTSHCLPALFHLF